MSSSVFTETPRLDAPEVLRRLLALIDSVREPQDLTIERVAQFTGFPMKPFSDKPANDTYVISQLLTENWRYRYLWGPNGTTHLPELGLAFYKRHSGQHPPKTEICQLDAAQFHEALLQMGYRHVGSTRRESPAKQYERGVVEVEIGIVGESDESLEKISHDCIKRVSIGFLVEDIGFGDMQ